MSDILRELDIYKIACARQSVRSFEGVIPAKTLNAIENFISDNETPFGNDARVSLIDFEQAGTTGKKVTYGLLSGFRYAIAAEVDEEADYAMIQIGYCLERAVLFCTAVGISSCYLGGTYKKGIVSELLASGEGKIVPAIVAIGEKSSRQGFVPGVMRKLAKGGERKEFEDMFFNETFDQSLNQMLCGDYYPALEALRIAPSSGNSQPWQVVKCGENIHFYKDTTKKQHGEFDLNELDMGIGLCHFGLVAESEGLYGRFSTEEHPDGGTELDYITTFVRG